MLQFTPTRPFTNLPICLNCAHVRRTTTNNATVCSLNGRVDPVTGVITHTACTVARSNDTMCGPHGRFFVHYLALQDSSDDEPCSNN